MCPGSPAAPGEWGRWLHPPVCGFCCVHCTCQQFGFHTWLKPEMVTLQNPPGTAEQQSLVLKYLNMIHTASTCLPSALLSPWFLEVGEKQAETQHKPLPLPHASSQFDPRIPPTPELWAYAFLTCLRRFPGLSCSSRPFPCGAWDKDPPLKHLSCDTGCSAFSALPKSPISSSIRALPSHAVGFCHANPLIPLEES